MQGNVWEWCLDSWDNSANYPAGPVSDPYVGNGPVRVLRGGSWYDFSNWCRSASRGYQIPTYPDQSFGFRVVCAPVVFPQPTPNPALNMVAIAPGTFQMGSPLTPLSVAPFFNQPQSQPVHAVTITQPFWMGRHEVTQAQYQAVMGSNPSFFQGASWPNAANRPVERVSWFNAVAYCDALTVQEAAAGRLPAGYEYRLPTEAEWEYCCRAGTTTEFHYGGTLVCGQANFAYSYHTASSCSTPGGVSTAVVGSYAANAWGLHDMHGNVFEWCLDSWDGSANYPAGPVSDPYVTNGPVRVERGGSWSNDSYICRSAIRNGLNPSNANNSVVGFRVVCAPVLP
jgi:formylglycine-generating enzyme required for sulfatase activity